MGLVDAWVLLTNSCSKFFELVYDMFELLPNAPYVFMVGGCVIGVVFWILKKLI